MKIPMFAILPLLILTACSQPAKKADVPPVDVFAGAKGCFLLYNMKTAAFDEAIGGDVCRERLSASSTFKVPLAVMAFDSGVLKDENVVLKWDGKKDEREAVNRDHDAKTWMRDSVVWFSQRLTPKIGRPRLQKYLRDFHYGNEDLSGGLTTAWLVSPAKKGALAISAYEQVDFMKALWTDALPASTRAQRLTREIMFLETSPQGFHLSGKTGSNFYDKDRKVRLGWFIGHLHKGDRQYLVVTNFSDLGPTEEKIYGGLKAKQIAKDVLASKGLW